MGKVWVIYARYLWEQAYGPIPEDYEVHHKDNDKLNDVLDNYELLGHSPHAKLHALTKKGGKSRTGYHNNERQCKAARKLLTGNTYWVGRKHKESTKELIAKALTGRKKSEESKAKLRATWIRKRNIATINLPMDLSQNQPI